ncbi:MAG: hypothetical protein SXV54_13765, partial [Chloroflexota bacterium]|nr:hypothetical protein [Chloroflexota bacterium]
AVLIGQRSYGRGLRGGAVDRTVNQKKVSAKVLSRRAKKVPPIAQVEKPHHLNNLGERGQSRVPLPQITRISPIFFSFSCYS